MNENSLKQALAKIRAKNITSDSLMTTSEVAQAIRVSRATVMRWADTGALPCRRTVGGHRRFVLREVAAMVLPSKSRKQMKLPIIERAVELPNGQP